MASALAVLGRDKAVGVEREVRRAMDGGTVMARGGADDVQLSLGAR